MTEHKHAGVDAHTGTSTTGHDWDGIQELNTPLPRWWLYTFYACIVWAIGYWISISRLALVWRRDARPSALEFARYGRH